MRIWLLVGLLLLAACAPRGPQPAAALLADDVPALATSPPADAAVAAVDATAPTASGPVPSFDAATRGVDGDGAAGAASSIDLAEYGLAPSYRPPAPTPVAMTDAQRRVLDELDRLARLLASDLPTAELYRRMGTVRSRADRWVDLSPAAAELSSIVVRVDADGPAEAAIAVREPLPVRLLEDRFGALESYLQGHRDGDVLLFVGARAVDVGAGLAVELLVALPDAGVPDQRYEQVSRVTLARRPAQAAPPAPHAAHRRRARR